MNIQIFGTKKCNDAKTADVPAVNEEYKKVKNSRHLYDLLSEIWCADTCAPRMRDGWSKENID